MSKHRVFDYTVETSVSPQRMVEAATDFSERRPALWPLITRKTYRVYSTGDREAEVDEGTRPTHHRVKYTWTDDTVRGETIDASGVTAGSLWEMKVRPRDGGGSFVDLHMEMTFKGLMGFMGQMRTSMGGGARVFQNWFMRTIRILEAEQERVDVPTT